MAQLQQIAQGFINSLSGYSVFDKVVADGGFIRLPPQTRAVTVAVTGTGAAETPGETHANGITQFTLESTALVEWLTTAIIVLNEEVVYDQSSDAFNFLMVSLKKAVAEGVDRKFMDILTEDTGVASNASTGTTAAQFAADLSTAALAVTTSANSRLYLAASASVVKKMAMARTTSGDVAFPGLTTNGGNFAGITITPCDLLTSTALLFDSNQIVAYVGPIEQDNARHADLQLTDTATDGGTLMTSLWQNNGLGMRARRRWGAVPLAPTAVAVITGYS